MEGAALYIAHSECTTMDTGSSYAIRRTRHAQPRPWRPGAGLRLGILLGLRRAPYECKRFATSTWPL